MPDVHVSGQMFPFLNRPQEPAVKEKDDKEQSEHESAELTSPNVETRDFKLSEKELPAATLPSISKEDSLVVQGGFKGFSFKQTATR